jgi:hypothetical protein
METPKNAILEAGAGKPLKPRARPFRPQAQQPKEHALQAQILAYLRRERRVEWCLRVNSGCQKVGNRWVVSYRLYLQRRKPTTKGVSDIVGMLENGRLFALEVKQPGEKPSAEQNDFLAAVLAGGGIAGIVYSWENARELLFDG